MQTKKEKIVFTLLTALVALCGYQSLVYILNLNQTRIFIQVACALYIYLMLKVLFLYDLHFKKTGNLTAAKQQHSKTTSAILRYLKIYFFSLTNRTQHFWQQKSFGLYFNYLLLPTLIFWSTVILIYLNFGALKYQQLFALLSTVAAIVVYWGIKEIFSRRSEIVDKDVFVVMTVAKLYTAAVSYGSALAILRSFCQPAEYFALIVFCLSFSFIFQALFQHKLTTKKNLLVAFVLSIIQAILAFYVYCYWGLNFYSAGVILTVSYNLLWGSFHYHLDRALTKKTFFEILMLSLIIASLLFGATNFKARLLDGCDYSAGI